MRSHINRYKQSGVTFSGDWEALSDTGLLIGPGTWGSSEVASADRFTRVGSPTPRQGSYCARVELQAGDDPKGDGSSRCELCLPKTHGNKFIYVGPNTMEQYIGFSVMLDATWAAPDGSGNRWTLVAQLHGPDADGGLYFTLHAEDRFYIEVRTGDTSEQDEWPDFELSDNALEKGHWIDFIVYIKFDKTNGLIKLWRRDEADNGFALVCTANTHPFYGSLPTLAWVGSNPVPNSGYWKTGIYRNPTCTFTHLCYLDGFTVGRTFADVERAISRRA